MFPIVRLQLATHNRFQSCSVSPLCTFNLATSVFTNGFRVPLLASMGSGGGVRRTCTYCSPGCFLLYKDSSVLLLMVLKAIPRSSLHLRRIFFSLLTGNPFQFSAFLLLHVISHNALLTSHFNASASVQNHSCLRKCPSGGNQWRPIARKTSLQPRQRPTSPRSPQFCCVSLLSYL